MLDFSFLQLLMLVLHNFCSRNVWIKLLQDPLNVKFEERFVDLNSFSEHWLALEFWLLVFGKSFENFNEVLNGFEETDESLTNHLFQFCQFVNPLVDWRLNPAKFLF